jgi:hypothetical protein
MVERRTQPGVRTVDLRGVEWRDTVSIFIVRDDAAANTLVERWQGVWASIGLPARQAFQVRNLAYLAPQRGAFNDDQYAALKACATTPRPDLRRFRRGGDLVMHEGRCRDDPAVF